MIKKINEADSYTLRKFWYEYPKVFEEKYSRAMILDEIGWAIIDKDPNGKEFLLQFVYDKDVMMRNTALYILASKNEKNPELCQMVLDAFFCENESVKMTALQALIKMKVYPLKKKDLKTLEEAKDKRIPAWGMVYLCFAYPKQRSKILKKAVNSKNPKLREFACDVIGDEFLYELKELMHPLLTDNNSRVRQAANYNYYEMLAPN